MGMDVVEFPGYKERRLVTKSNFRRILKLASGCGVEFLHNSGKFGKAILLGTGPERRRARDYMQKRMEGAASWRTEQLPKPELEKRNDVTIIELTSEEAQLLGCEDLSQVEAKSGSLLFFRQVPDAELLTARGARILTRRGGRFVLAEVLEAGASGGDEGEITLKLRVVPGNAELTEAHVDNEYVEALVIFGHDLGPSGFTGRAYAEKLVRELLANAKTKAQSSTWAASTSWPQVQAEKDAYAQAHSSTSSVSTPWPQKQAQKDQSSAASINWESWFRHEQDGGAGSGDKSQGDWNQEQHWWCSSRGDESAGDWDQDQRRRGGSCRGGEKSAGHWDQDQRRRGGSGGGGEKSTGHWDQEQRQRGGSGGDEDKFMANWEQEERRRGSSGGGGERSSGDWDQDSRWRVSGGSAADWESANRNAVDWEEDKRQRAGGSGGGGDRSAGDWESGGRDAGEWEQDNHWRSGRGGGNAAKSVGEWEPGNTDAGQWEWRKRDAGWSTEAAQAWNEGRGQGGEQAQGSQHEMHWAEIQFGDGRWKGGGGGGGGGSRDTTTTTDAAPSGRPPPGFGPPQQASWEPTALDDNLWENYRSTGQSGSKEGKHSWMQ